MSPTSYREGWSKDNFDEWSYLASHEDLIDAFGSDATAATRIIFLMVIQKDGVKITLMNGYLQVILIC